MRGFGFMAAALMSAAMLVGSGLAQDTTTDAKSAIADEWRDHQDQCLEALKLKLLAPSSSAALSELKRGQTPFVKQVYDDAGSSDKFWDTVASTPRSLGASETKKDPDLTNARSLVDAMYHGGEIPLLKTALGRFPVSPVDALTILLDGLKKVDAAKSAADFKKDLDDMRGFFASDDAAGSPHGTALFAHVKKHFMAK